MYCVIQKIINLKPHSYGEYKELKVDSTTWTFDGNTRTSYSYSYTGGRFERPIKDAYKISIHKSYRENGQVKKKQWVICTMSYYDLIEFGLYDCGDGKISKVSELTGMAVDDIYDMIYKKLQPIIDIVEEEFRKTEEYKTKQKHKKIINAYLKAKEKFEGKYGQDTYDYCYDVFGTLKNPEYLKQLQANYEAQQQSYKNYSSYYESYGSNHNNTDYSSYYGKSISNYTEDEKERLKKIYRVLAIKFHPDRYKEDNGEIMQLVNKLKENWGI